MPRLLRAVVALVAAVAMVGPASSDALSLQHRDDVQHGFRALTQTFYRGIEPSKLVAGARSGIADALQKRHGNAPAFPARDGDDALAQIVASIDRARGRGG